MMVAASQGRAPAMPLAELLGMPGCAGAATPISGLQADSRAVVPGDLFLAVPGRRTMAVSSLSRRLPVARPPWSPKRR